MSDDVSLHGAVGRIEATSEATHALLVQHIDRFEKVEVRVRGLERSRAWLAGVGSALALFFGAVLKHLSTLITE